jgi:hypothetical protein
MGRVLPALPPFPKERLVFTSPITHTDGSYAVGVGGAVAVRVHPCGHTETLADGTFPCAQSSYRAELWGLLAAHSHTGHATFGVDCLNLMRDVENATAWLA